jgi:hypothetical protein
VRRVPTATACTVLDQCIGGACTGTQTLVCNDAEPVHLGLVLAGLRLHVHAVTGFESISCTFRRGASRPRAGPLCRTRSTGRSAGRGSHREAALTQSPVKAKKPLRIALRNLQEGAARGARAPRQGQARRPAARASCEAEINDMHGARHGRLATSSRVIAGARVDASSRADRTHACDAQGEDGRARASCAGGAARAADRDRRRTRPAPSSRRGSAAPCGRSRSTTSTRARVDRAAFATRPLRAVRADHHGRRGQYASRDFGFPRITTPNSSPNMYAPGAIEDTTGGGNATEVTFVAGDAPALVAGFGAVFVDPDLPVSARSPSSATKASRSATPRSRRRTASASSAASSRSTPTPACRSRSSRACGS